MCSGVLVRAGAALVTMLAATAMAQEDPPINTERPSFSASPLALTPRKLQVEAGYQYTDGDIDVQTLPLALLRVGLVDRVELQLSWAGRNRADANPGSFSGWSDLGVGVKWQLTESDATVPLAVFAGLSLPTGSRQFTSDSVDPTVGLFWSYTGSQSWFGTVSLTDLDGDRVLANGLGLSIPISGRVGGYVEYAGQYPEDSGPAHTLNSGITFTPRPNVQWDINTSFGLNDRAPDISLGAGVAYRF